MTATGETRQVLLQPHDNKIGRGPTNDVIVDSSQQAGITRSSTWSRPL